MKLIYCLIRVLKKEYNCVLNVGIYVYEKRKIRIMDLFWTKTQNKKTVNTLYLKVYGFVLCG